MPYGYTTTQWNRFPPEVKQAIMQSQSSLPPSGSTLDQDTFLGGLFGPDVAFSGTGTTSPGPGQAGYDPYQPLSPSYYGLDPNMVNQDPLLYSAWMFVNDADNAVDPEINQWANAFLAYAGGSDAFNVGAQKFIDVIGQGAFGIGPSGNYGWNVESPFFDQSSLGAGTGGGFISDRGGPALPQAAKFSDIDINFANAPDWWKAVAPDVYNPISEYQTFANLLIPLLSPEDQYTVATNLYQSAPDQFAHLNPETIERSPAALDITPEMRRTYFTGERAQKALDAFDRLLEISGKTSEDLGPGYEFLRGLADTVRDFGLTSGASQLTETQQGQLLSALDPLLAQSKGGALASFGPLAQSFVNPFFSAGSLTGTVKNQFGDIINPRNPRYL